MAKAARVGYSWLEQVELARAAKVGLLPYVLFPILNLILALKLSKLQPF